MSQLAQHPAYLKIESLLDSIGRRERAYQLTRGGVLFLTTLAGSTVAGALLADVAPEGLWPKTVAAAVLAGNVAAFVWWVGRPILLRPRRLAVARLVESRLPDVHNALTNGVLLAHADDLAANPWTPAILDEIARAVSGRPLHEAVCFRTLRPLGLTFAGVLVAAGTLVALLPSRFVHGFHQLRSPMSFVPKVGQVKIVEVRPGDATLIRGQSLEIGATVEGVTSPVPGRVLFRSAVPIAMSSAVAADGRVHYGYRIERVEEPLEYRLEVGDSQTPWYKVSVVREVQLQGVGLLATAPGYTRREPIKSTTPAQELPRANLTVLQGSRVELTFDLDVPVKGAMLQIGEATPTSATASEDGKRFSASLTMLQDSAISLLLLDAAGQIISRVPADPLQLHVTPDAAPSIEMKWPTQDTSIAPADSLRIEARLRDDYGVVNGRVLLTPALETPMEAAAIQVFPRRETSQDFSAVAMIKPEWARHGQSVWVQVEAADNRDLTKLMSNGEAQTSRSRRFEIRFRDPRQAAAEDAKKVDRLRERLSEMLKQQRALNEKTQAFMPGNKTLLPAVKTGQMDLRTLMQTTVERFEFDQDTRVIQKTLLVLVGGTAREAVDVAQGAITEPVALQQGKLVADLQTKQRRIIQTLESLLAMLRVQAEPTTRVVSKEGGDLTSQAEEFKKLDEALKEFIKEEQRILDATTSLAKKPVDNFDEKEKKLLEELKLAQEKMDAFMQQKVSDFSNVAEQDMANASLLRELLEVYSEVTMAKEALKDKAVEMAISSEEMGLELAKAIDSNLEKWLMDKPDRQKWTQEDQIQKTEAPMAELPAELEDMIGELMEQQEDLFEEMEDANANWHDALNKGAGWDAGDGPIDNMNAQGVTGNQLPNNNEMGGRAGEGRSGKSQGEMVEETATGKGGRNTPTRLDPTPFQQGQVKDESKYPVGGATGGGKISGQGGAGLEGPVPPKIKQEMERLAQKQAEIRNSAERLNLQYQLGHYDNFKLLESIAIMRRTESDLRSNRYQNALRRRDITLDAMDASRTLLGGQVSVQRDTTPVGNRKLQQEIGDAMKGRLPAAWGEPLKEYYRKLGAE